MKKVILFSVIGAFMLAGVLLSIQQYVLRQAYQPPKMHPGLCADLPDDKQRVLFLGDSLTHGRVSYDFVDHFEGRVGKEYSVINAGVNSHLAINLVQRIDKAIRCEPDYSFIMIGTNDVNATLSEKRLEGYRKQQGIKRKPDKVWYIENLTTIITRLKKETKSRIAVYSLPLLGEKLDTVANKRVQEYSAAIKKLAARQNIVYLPYNEWQHEYVQVHGGADVCEGEFSDRVALAVGSHYLLGNSWQEIADANGFRLLTDCIHLNETAGRMLVDMALQQLR